MWFDVMNCPDEEILTLAIPGNESIRLLQNIRPKQTDCGLSRPVRKTRSSERDDISLCNVYVDEQTNNERKGLQLILRAHGCSYKKSDMYLLNTNTRHTYLFSGNPPANSKDTHRCMFARTRHSTQMIISCQSECKT